MTHLLAEKNRYSLLKVIPEEKLSEFLTNQSMQIKSYNTGEVIHFEADSCTGVEIILEGQVAVERIDESGYLMTITLFGANEILGANLVYSKNPFYPMTVTAKKATSLLFINKSFLFTLCTTNPEFLKLFLAYISDHTLLLGDKIKHNVNRSIRASLIAFLKEEHLKQSSYRIVLPTSKKALADRIGIQRTSLSRELQKMKNEGLIDYDALSITIIEITLVK